MNSETGGGGENYFNESLSKSFKIADSFRRDGVLGEKRSDEEKNIANEKVSEILNRSFPVPSESDGQIHSIIKYDSVTKMVEISKPQGGRTPIAQENAKKALFEIGLALSQNNEILKAATEGINQFNKLIPSNLEGIQPYILSSILTNGKDDREGQEMVSELVDLFKLKKKSDERPGYYEKDLKEASNELFDKLWNRRENLDARAVADGTEGRIEAAIGYITEIDEKIVNTAVASNNGEVINTGPGPVTGSNEVATRMAEATERLAQLEAERSAREVRAEADRLTREAQAAARAEQERLTREAQAAARAEQDPGLLDYREPSEVLAFAEGRLDFLESTAYRSNDLAISRETTTPLNEVLYKLKSDMYRDVVNAEGLSNADVATMIETRMAIHDSWYYMSASGFKISERGGLAGAAGSIADEDRMLDKTRLEFAFKDCKEKFGLPVDKAWDLLEDANFNYKDLLRDVVADLRANNPGANQDDINKWEGWCNLNKISAKYGKNTTVEGKDEVYWFDDKAERKAAVDAFILKKITMNVQAGPGQQTPEQLQQARHEAEVKAKKAFQMAKKLITATGERSMFNFALLKNDDFAETIHFSYFRIDDARKGKNVGAMSTLGVQSLTPGWLRTMGGSRQIGKLKANDIKFDKNEGKGEFFYYFSQTLNTKTNGAKNAFLDNAPDPKKILSGGVAYLNSIVDNFNKLEPSFDIVKLAGSKDYVRIGSDPIPNSNQKRWYIKDENGRERPGFRLDYDENTETCNVYDASGRFLGVSEKSRDGEDNFRAMYALGLMEMVSTKPELGWGVNEITELKRILVDVNLTANVPPFLSEESWKWLTKQVVMNNGKKNYTLYEAIRFNRKRKRKMAFIDALIEEWKGGKTSKKK